MSSLVSQGPNRNNDDARGVVSDDALLHNAHIAVQADKHYHGNLDRIDGLRASASCAAGNNTRKPMEER